VRKLDQTTTKTGLVFLDGLLHVFHISIILFFLFGWMLPKTRMVHYILALLILFSWCGLGMVFGFGYCLITDIQWRVKKILRQEPTTDICWITSQDVISVPTALTESRLIPTLGFLQFRVT